MAKQEYSEEVIRNLKTIIDHFDESDREVRDRQLRLWKMLDFYWNGLRPYWDEVAHDWRVYNSDVDGDENQAGYYDKPINVFRAYLESIIAALSATVPGIKCYPDDADNPNDILTAKGGTKISKLVYEHIDADLLWVKALFTYCIQGMVAAYNYSVEDEAYGTTVVNEYEDQEVPEDYSICPSCGRELLGDELKASEGIAIQAEDEFRPDYPNPISEVEQTSGQVACPQCQMMFNPNVQQRTILVERIVGRINKPKARQAIDVAGGLFVNVPNWARKQEDCPYLEYAYETHYSNVLAKYPHLRDKLGIQGTNIASSDTEYYGRWGRLSPQYLGTMPLNTPTCRNWWLRSSAFEVINDEAHRDELKKLFPKGVKAVFVNDQFAEACPESMDDYWTLTFNPLSDYVHFDPLGMLLVSVQDITNELINLTLQTIEHGIPQTFADPSVLNFEQYKNTEVAPGALFPAKAKGGKGLGDGFFTVATATLSKEVDPFSERINQLGQLTSGALPTLFGGSLPSAQRTAAQYQMSRNQALQRLQTTWKIFNVWWKKVFGKVIPAYMKNMIEDERIVTAVGDSFVNLVIKKAELNGKIGSIHLESSEELPKTWGQIRDMVMEIVKLNNPEILTILGSPENLDVMQKIFEPTGLKVPNEADREKQLEEIQLLIRSGPIMVPGMGLGAPPQMMSTIQPSMDVDNHEVEAQICRAWLVGEPGRQAKVDNNEGYENVLAHYRAHLQALQMMQMMQPVQPQMENGNDGTEPEQPTIN